MNVVKRRWPDLLIGLLVLLLLGGFAALLLGKGNGGAGTQAQTSSAQPSGGQPSGGQTSGTQAPAAQPSTDQASTSQAGSTPAPGPTTPPVQTPPAGSASDIPTIAAAPVTGSDAPGTTSAPAQTPAAAPDTTAGAAATAPAGAVAPRVGGAVAVSEDRTPTRNDYRVSLGKFTTGAAQTTATAGVSGLGYVVHPIPVVGGVVAQVGPFASREQATQALGDIQRAFPGALLYPPRNAPAGASTPAATLSAPATPPGSTAPASTTPADTGRASPAPAAAAPAQATPDGPVYLQVGAFNSSEAAQTAVARVRGLGLDPSVNAPAGKLVTVVVGPFQGQALTSAETKLRAGGLDSFRVR